MKIHHSLLAGICLLFSALPSYGLDWTASLMDGVTAASRGVNSLAYGNGVYLAGGENVFVGDDYAFRSTDGETWTAIPELTNVTSFRFINGEFWKMGRVRGGVGISTSSDGLTWQTVELPDSADFNLTWNEIIYGDEGYVAVGRYKIFHSTDGQDWTLVFEHSDNITWVDWAGDRYFAGDSALANRGAPLLMSLDGVTWTEVNDEAFTALRTSGAAYGNSIYGVGAVFPGFPATPVYSEDASNWTAAPTLDLRSPSDFFFSGDRFFYLGTNVSTSQDMQTFTIEPIGEAVDSQTFSAVAGVEVDGAVKILIALSDESYYLASAELTTSSQPYLTESAQEFGEGWYYLGWLGFFNTSYWPWVYSDILDWFYAGTSANDLDGSWLYMTHPALNNWFWTSQNTNNWLYGQPAGYEAGWWYMDRDDQAGVFYLFSIDGSTTITSE